jgi:hypothetical protein
MAFFRIVIGFFLILDLFFCAEKAFFVDVSVSAYRKYGQLSSQI